MILAAIVLILAAPPELAPRVALGESYWHFSLGQQARLAGRVDEALDEYRRALRLDPRSGDIHAEMARVLLEAGRIDEARQEALLGVKTDPASTAAHLVLAQILQLGGGGSEEVLTQAAAEYAEVVKQDPTDGRSLKELADLYGYLRKPQQAALAWESYLTLDPGNADAHVQLGAQLLAAGDSDRAASTLREALELQPTSARAYEKLAEVYARAQQTDQAVLHYRKALELEPRNLTLRLSLGEVLYAARRHQEALTEVDALLAADPQNRFALDLRGRCLRDLRDFDKAMQVVESVLAKDPDDLKTNYLKVTILEARRDYTTAADLIEKILTRNRTGEDPTQSASTDRVFLIHLGFARQQLGQPAEAAAAFARAKATGGDPDATLLGYHVEALVQAKNFDQALTEVRAARLRFPDDADLISLEATILRERKDLPGALALVEKLRERSPKDVGVLVQVGEFYQRAKRWDDAEAVLVQARELAPKDVRVLFILGAVLERKKDHDGAEGVFRDALSVQPDSAPILNYLGYMNADRGVRLEEAARLLERAVALDPENGAYRDSLGWAQFRMHRLDLAEGNLRKAIEKFEKNAVILDHLGDILKARGNVQEALVWWQKALVGEDDDEELDRTAVEAKIQDAEKAFASH